MIIRKVACRLTGFSTILPSIHPVSRDVNHPQTDGDDVTCNYGLHESSSLSADDNNLRHYHDFLRVT